MNAMESKAMGIQYHPCKNKLKVSFFNCWKSYIIPFSAWTCISNFPYKKIFFGLMYFCAWKFFFGHVIIPYTKTMQRNLNVIKIFPIIMRL